LAGRAEAQRVHYNIFRLKFNRRLLPWPRRDDERRIYYYIIIMIIITITITIIMIIIIAVSAGDRWLIYARWQVSSKFTDCYIITYNMYYILFTHNSSFLFCSSQHKTVSCTLKIRNKTLRRHQLMTFRKEIQSIYAIYESFKIICQTRNKSYLFILCLFIDRSDIYNIIICILIILILELVFITL